ncbi:glycopeptide antibiotics resistance protein [Agromyces flavus]|uniref:Glycopeptide antibiotics resistance protein n=1 Tax=Agromyces flavus TaxID=589382 RepID=A0ABT1KID6_9MICO|nr:VanZ family protein [Agromyces flavus]MCP2366240.1 glycopeptide antibiotics resistance protein [Agromyces flavus]GGI44278.1 VanZ family protein [Agromyces flavus]
MLFAVYLVLLAWVVLWKLELPYFGQGGLRHVKLVPFAPTAQDGASDPVEVVANVLLFVPFGFYLGLLAPSWRWPKVAGVLAASSLALEVVQYALTIGSADVTDVVVNTAGGLAGLGLIVLARRRLRQRTSVVVARVCSIVTVVLILAVGAFIASPVRYAPMRDVHVPAVSPPYGLGPD